MDVEKIQAAQTAVQIAGSILGDIESFMADGPRKAIVSGTLMQRYTSITGKPLP
jgi:hypothetical protein